VKLLPEQQVTNAHRTANTEAYNQYLLGNQYYNRGSNEGYDLAVVAYQKAVALDANYAAAYAGLAIAEFYASDFSATAEESTLARQRAQAAADKAIALAPDLADGYVARGLYRSSIMWDWSGAQVDFDKALALEPGNASAHRRIGILLQNLGRLPEAIAAARKAVELHPLSSSAWSNLGAIYLSNPDRFREAREALDRALSINPEAGLALHYLVVLELLEGHAQVALDQSRRAGEVWR